MTRPVLDDDHFNNEGRSDKAPVNHVARGICGFILMNFMMIALLLIVTWLLK